MRKSRIGPDLDPAAIDEMLDRFSLLGTPAADPIRTLIFEMQADDVPEKYGREVGHVIEDCLWSLRLEGVASAKHATDVGSGYGFPGLVLAAALPETRFWLVEFDPVRCQFLRRTMEAMGLLNVEVVNWPVEEWRDNLRRCDLVTARNVASLSTMVEWAAPLLSVGGRALLWSRWRDEVEEADARAAADATGLSFEEVVQASPDLMAHKEKRHIHIYVKRDETPAAFPRPRKVALRDPIRALVDDRPRTRWDEALRKRELTEAKRRSREKAGPGE